MDCIELGLKGKNREEVILELSEIAVKCGAAASADKVFEFLMRREKMLSTAIGKGIAIPHPRNPSDELFLKPAVIFGRSAEGLDFYAPDGRKVHIFFMPCAPDVVLHLKLLSRIAKFLESGDMFRKLMAVKTKEDFIKLLLKSEKETVFVGIK